MLTAIKHRRLVKCLLFASTIQYIVNSSFPFFPNRPQPCCHRAKNRSATRCIPVLPRSCTELHTHHPEHMRASLHSVLTHCEQEACADKERGLLKAKECNIASIALCQADVSFQQCTLGIQVIFFIF